MVKTALMHLVSQFSRSFLHLKLPHKHRFLPAFQTHRHDLLLLGGCAELR